MGAVDDVEDTRGEAGLTGEAGDDHGRAGVLLGGLEQEGVTAGDGQREHPQGDHGGEVEGRNAGAHAEGLAVAVGVDVLAHVLGGLAHQNGAGRAGVLHDLCKPHET